jgi:hypothetical protein
VNGRASSTENAEGLNAFAAAPRSVRERLRKQSGATGPEARNVKKYVRQAIVRHDEAVALRRVKPFDHASDLEDLEKLRRPSIRAR